MSATFERPPAEPPEGAVLAANVERLMRRAYVPVRPAPEFVRRLERMLPMWLAAARAPELSRRRPRRLVPLLAAALALIVSWIALAPDDEVPELADLLARGDAARRVLGAEAWSAIEPRAARAGVLLADAPEEFATPDGLALELHMRSGALGALAPSSRATLASEDDGALRVRLDQGSCALTGGVQRVELSSTPGELTLCARVGALAATLELVPTPVRLRAPGAGERALLVRLDAGSAALAQAVDARELRAPDVFLVHGGELHTRDGAPRTLPAPADSSVRSAIPPSVPDAPSAEHVTFSGRVRALPGARPIERFRVLLLRSVDLPRVAEPDWRDFESTDGGFRWEGLEPGMYSVFVQAEGRAQWSARGLVLAAGEERSLDVELVQGATVRGFVVDRASGAPLAGAVVLSQTDSPTQVLHRYEDEQTAVVTARTKSGPDGSFELRHLSTGEHDLRSSAPEHAPSWVHTLALRDGEVLDGALFELEAGATIHGKVERAGGPRVGALVIASQFGGGSTASVMTYGHGITDEQGDYEIPHLSSGAYVVLLFGDAKDMEREQPEIAATELPNEGRRRVDFLHRSDMGSLRGRLTDETGAPVANATVSLAHPGDQGMTGWKAAGSGADGTYELVDLAPGAYLVHVGLGSGLVLQGEVHVAAGEELVRDFQLAGGSIRVRVVDARDGSRLEHALLLLGRHVEPNGTESFPSLDPLIGKTWTTGGEHFEFPFVPPGRYDLIAGGAEGGFAQLVITDLTVVGSEVVECDVALAPGGGLRLAIVDADGEPRADAELELYDPHGRRIDLFLLSSTRADGVHLLPDLEPGLWRALARAPGRTAIERAVSIEAGATLELELRFER